MSFEELKETLKKQKRNAAFIISLAIGLFIAGYLVDVFLDILEALGEKELAPFDDAVALYVEKIRSQTLTDFFRVASKFSDQEFYFIAIPILALVIYKVYGKLRKAFRLTLVLIIASVITTLLKGFIERPRPKGEHLVEVATYSFPSGHTVSSVAFYGFLIYIFVTSDLSTPAKIALTVLLSLVILSVALSRIYLGVHYASDVIGGLLAGAFFLVIFILSIYITKFLKHRKNNSN